ncbi:MAG: hypothetical protein IJJ33_00300, partial [Victivallales bacterium]|nr:hypothetical protein [Victivallales bacterium]
MFKRLLWLSAICGTVVMAGEPKLGISLMDARKFAVEYEQYSDEAKHFHQANITSTYLEHRYFHPDEPSLLKELPALLREFNVVWVRAYDEGIRVLNDDKRAYATRLGEVLAAYVQEGGGLLLEPSAVRYPSNDDERYWNIVLESFGLHQKHEGLSAGKHDRSLECKTGWKSRFFFTDSIALHPVTAGVRGIWVPVQSYTHYAATPLIACDEGWKVIVDGGQNGGSVPGDPHTNAICLDVTGSVSSHAPVVAVREFGKGRVLVLPIHRIHTGDNLGKPSWAHIVETRGAEGLPSDLMLLLTNAVKWLAQPNLDKPGFGTWSPKPFRKIAFPASVEFDSVMFKSDASPCAVGIIGAHSSLSDGGSTVAEYVQAARKAGLQFIVFADPLEKLSTERIDALKQECQAVSSDKFLAVPGIEFTDGAGLRHFFVGEKIAWPDEKPFTKGDFTYRLWDGERVRFFGKYVNQCGCLPSGFIDYRQFDSLRIRRENLWWFWLVPLAVYDGNNLVADNGLEYPRALHDLRVVMPTPFTRIHHAAEVAGAADCAVLKVKDLESARRIVSNTFSIRFPAERGMAHVVFGKGHAVDVLSWQVINDQMDPRLLHTRGVQRAIGHFKVASPNGIREVRVMDSTRGVFRRFDGGKAPLLERSFEIVHDRQHYLFLEVEDNAGGSAVTHVVQVFDYKQGLFRCGDNLNILGPLGYWWHPDRNQLLPPVKQLRTAELASVQGWDRAQADCPLPSVDPLSNLFIEGLGPIFTGQPADPMPAMSMDVRLAGNDLQIVDAVMDEQAESFNNASRPGPSFSSPARILGDNPWFIHRQRLYSPRDRMDHHVAWDHRRLRESLENYDGSWTWFEGEIEFRQDVTLDKNVSVPIELGRLCMEPRNMPALSPHRIVSRNLAGDITEQVFPVGFINYMLSEEPAIANAEYIYYASPNSLVYNNPD